MRYKPRFATIEEVTISRQGGTAVIDFHDKAVGGMNLTIGPEIRLMSDADILALYNEIVESQLESARTFRPLEIAQGRPQIKFDKKFREWSAEGHVLRCLIDVNEGEPTIQIDNHVLTLREFGKMLAQFNGWGMRVTFLSDDQLCEPPEPEVRKAPKRISKKELEELVKAEDDRLRRLSLGF